MGLSTGSTGSTTGSTTGTTGSTTGGTTGSISPGGPHYDVTYSGGTWFSNGPGGYITGDDVSANPGWGYSVGTGGGFWIFNFPIFLAGPGTCGNSGAITATYTWNNSSDTSVPPPPVAVVEEYARASWSGDSGSCANGKNDPPVGIPNGQVSSGTHYTVKQNPGWSFTTTVTPTANASFSGDGTYEIPMLSGGTSVLYRCAAYAVRIKLTTVKHPYTDKRLMIGHNLGAQIETDLPLLSFLDTYSWNVSGGDPFNAYVVVVTNGAPDSAHVDPFAVQTTPTLSTYLKTPASFTVTCQFTPFWLGTTLSLTENGEAIKPSNTFGAYMVDPELAPNMTHPVVDQLADSNATPAAPGIRWVGTVTTPSDFVSGGSYGWWNIVQFWTPNRAQDGLVYYDDRDSNDVNGRIGLDTSFPYETPMNVLVDLIHTYDFVADGHSDGSSDSPSQPLTDGTGYHSVVAFDSFKDWTLYYPPGNSQYVPLKSMVWYWKGNAHKNSGVTGWSWDAREKAWSFDQDFPPHPVWTWRHDTSHWHLH